MTAASAAARGRAAAAARMTSTCNVRRKTGATTLVGGFKVPVWATIHAAVNVRIGGAHSGSAQSRRLEVAGVGVEVPVRVASFAYDLTDLRDGDLIEMLSGDTDDLMFRIVEVDPQDQATARRAQVVGTTRPEEWT